MADKYLNYGDAGSNLGTLADPWASKADALAGVSAGDVVYSYDAGSGEVLSATLTASVAGTDAARIHFIATNASYVVDGTKYTLDGNAAAVNALNLSTFAGYLYTNFCFTGATGDGVTANQSAAVEHVFVNCEFYSNGGKGGYFQGGYDVFVLCRFYNNSSYGVDVSQNTIFQMCEVHGNATYGFRASSDCIIYRCLAYDDRGYVLSGGGNTIINSVVDDCTYGISVYATRNRALNCLVTNCTYGLYSTSYNFPVVRMAWYNNTNKESSVGKLVILIPDIDLTSDPYVNQAGRDYTLATPNTQIISLEYDIDGTNKTYETNGFTPPYSAGGGVMIDGSMVI